MAFLEHSLGARARWAALGSVSLIAFLLTWESGTRGLMPLDQLIVLDGGYRMFSGQVIYRDFVSPYGPIVYVLKALFFHLTGPTFGATVALAGLCNVAAALCCYLVLIRLSPKHEIAALIGALVTAIWFSPPFGSFYPEQVALLFGFFALLGVIPKSLQDGSRWRYAGSVAAGLCLALAFLSKQNIGVFLCPLIGGVLIFIYSHAPLRALRHIVAVGLGGVTGAALFWIWLNVYADPELFVRYFFEIPSQAGGERLGNLRGTVWGLLYGYTTDVYQVAYLPLQLGLILAVAGTVIGFMNRKKLEHRSLYRVSGLVLGVYFFQNLVMSSALNQEAIYSGYVGMLIGGLGILLAKLVGRFGWQKSENEPTTNLPSPQTVGSVSMFAYTLVVAGWMAIGSFVAMSREVHDIFEGVEFSDRVDVPLMNSVRWAVPTTYPDGTTITAKDIEEVYAYLKNRDNNFYILGDFTIFYPMLDKTPPQPLMWFHIGLTYPLDYDAEIDKWMVESLRKNAVETIVVESRCWFEFSESIYEDFPIMSEYLSANFRQVDTIGVFELYEHVRPESPAKTL